VRHAGGSSKTFDGSSLTGSRGLRGTHVDTAQLRLEWLNMAGLPNVSPAGYGTSVIRDLIP
jgi:hypothetical protein